MRTGAPRCTRPRKKVTAALLNTLAKHAFVNNLVSFELGDGQAKPPDAMEMLRKASRLEDLTLNFSYGGATANSSFLRSLASAWRTSRQGGTPLLRNFTATGWSESCKLIGFDLFEALPEVFPELETLKCSLDGLSIRGVSPEPIRFGFQPNLRLRELTVDSLIHSFGGKHLTTEQCGQALRIVFSAGRNLERLTLHHGRMHLSGREMKEGKRIEPSPGANGALAELPASLVSLNLGDIALTPTELDMHPGLPALKHLTLSRCGPQTIGLARAAAADRDKCPLLKASGIFTREDGGGRYHYGSLVCLDPEVEAKLVKAKAAREAAAREAPAAKFAASSSTQGVEAEEKAPLDQNDDAMPDAMPDAEESDSE